ncbi:hypothetical protein OIU84_018582 [Salix udensis]|uniref:Uncharacterized protein n=1 Tax=Salix udensis TaxID=889485 RepID=A0AAD6PIF0_9ROSI|nr:hypothetical protein OIU84_018582 [Salix udensis]
MGFPKKPPAVDGGLDLDGSKRWVISGIPLRAPLKPISTNPVKKEINDGDDDATTTRMNRTTVLLLQQRLLVRKQEFLLDWPARRLPGSEKLLSSVIIAVLVLGSSSLLLTWKPFLFKGQTDRH